MTLPQNQQAEKAALSLLHHSPQCLSGFRQELFHHPSHKMIFRAIEEAAASGQPTDLIALTSQIEANGNLEAVGGAGTLTELLFTLPGANPPQVPYYHEQLVRAHIARETVKAARENLSDLERMKLCPTTFAERVAAAAQGPQLAERATLKEHLDGLICELERTEPRETFSTGLTRLDLALDGGVHRGELLVVAGETSGGKSILLAQAALAVLTGGQ